MELVVQTNPTYRQKCKECVTDLGLYSKMIIFESLLTTFETNFSFKADGALAKLGLCLKPNQSTITKLNQVNHV